MKPASIRLTRRLAVVGGLAVAVAPPALAHRSLSVLTTIGWNGAKLALEVSHRIHAGDAEAGLTKASGVEKIDVMTAAGQSQLMRYVGKHFSLTDGANPIVLKPLPAELLPETVVLHQEARRSAPPAELVISDQILCDVFEDQTNLVNVTLATGPRTLIFSPGDDAKRVKGLI